MRELGKASHALNPGEELAKAMHDVRGGALAALLGRLQLIELVPRDEGSLNTLFVLARDHLKIMRNAIVGLDEPRREADHQPKSHDVRLILEKWHNSVVGPKWHERQIEMSLDCRHAGALTECCLESAAIDRIFYNLANNACRHAASERLDMVIFPVPQAPGECLRFVLSNEVSEEDAAYLRKLLPDGADSADKGTGQSIFSLFEPEVSWCPVSGLRWWRSLCRTRLACATGNKPCKSATWGRCSTGRPSACGSIGRLRTVN